MGRQLSNDKKNRPRSAGFFAAQTFFKSARVEFDERDNIFIGRVLGIRTMISFHDETVAKLRSEFEKAVNDFVREYKRKRD